MNIFTEVFFILFYLTISHSQSLYKKVVNDVDPEAKCLDGSYPFFYQHKGSQQKKFLIYFQGGGLCSGMDLNSAIEDCYQRSKTTLGSSTPWPDTLDAQGMGILQTDPQKSKFAQWNKLIIGYCDGSLHQGYRQKPIIYKNTSLYFRGASNSRAIFAYLQKYQDLANAEKLILSGGSAGGVASYLWSNYAASKISDPNNIAIIPDSGVFLKYNTYQTDVKVLQTLVQNNFALANLDEKTPMKICNQKYSGKQYQCIFLENSFMEISPRCLLINSQYDAWSIENTLQMQCISKGASGGQTLQKCNEDEMQYIQGYRQKFLDFIKIYSMFSRNSAWTISCSNHGYTFKDKFYNSQNQQVHNVKIIQAVEKFIFQQARIQQIDEQKWPQNKACAY